MCTLSLSAYKSGCKNIGGISEFYLIDKSERLAAPNLVMAVASGALTITEDADLKPKAWKIQPRENNCTFTQPVTDENTAGTSFVTQTLEFTLHGYSATLVSLADEVRKGRMEALIKLRSGVYVYAGLDYTGLQSNGGSAGDSGTAIGDALAFTFTLTSEATEAAPVLADFTEFSDAFTIEVAS
jgi:hypothetical protein